MNRLDKDDMKKHHKFDYIIKFVAHFFYFVLILSSLVLCIVVPPCLIIQNHCLDFCARVSTFMLPVQICIKSEHQKLKICIKS